MQRSARSVEKGIVSAMRAVPSFIERPSLGSRGPSLPGNSSRTAMTQYSDPKDHVRMRNACQLAAHIRAFAGSKVAPGLSTDELDEMVHDEILRLGAFPSALGYAGFPKSCCTSVNEVLCHGIPDSRPLEEGDILKLDVVVYKDGFHGDCCGSFAVGQISKEDERLIKATEKATLEGISVVAPNVRISAIGDAIMEVAEKENFSVSPAFCGHGIGHLIHFPPLIGHTRNSDTAVCAVNSFFTIGMISMFPNV